MAQKRMPNFLKNILEENGFQTEEIDSEALLVKDFFSKDELDQVFEVINSTPNEEWFIEYHANLKHFCMQKFGRNDVDNLVAEGKFEITQNWQDKNLNIGKYPFQRVLYDRLNDLVQKVDTTIELSGFATIQRMQEGVELKAHTDQDTDPSIRYAAILYLNDDYVDGELFFLKDGVNLRPQPGSLLIFPGNAEYNHGVRHVGPGPIRYVLVGFIKEKGFYQKNRY
jgi:hypothetical protein